MRFYKLYPFIILIFIVLITYMIIYNRDFKNNFFDNDELWLDIDTNTYYKNYFDLEEFSAF